MRFYTQQHQFYCGIDLHTRSMYVCIMNHEGEIVVHRNMAASADELVKVIEPYRSAGIYNREREGDWSIRMFYPVFS